MLLLLDEKWDFESVYVDHGCDWPETREYVVMLHRMGYKITIIKPKVEGFSNLYEYCWHYKIIPSRRQRWCTHKFKVKILNNYFKTPCFTCIGFSTDEAHRAKLSYRDGQELRFPLLEYEMNRYNCEQYILKKGLPLPMRSGCWFCPFQRIDQWKLLRKKHPDLFCKAKTLEDREIERRIEKGKHPLYLGGKPLEIVINEAQGEFFEEYKPPCYCFE